MNRFGRPSWHINQTAWVQMCYSAVLNQHHAVCQTLTTPEGVSAHVLHSVYTTWSELRNSQGESEDAASTEVHPLGELKASLLKLAMIFPRSLLQRLPNGTLRFIGTTQRCLLLSVQMALIQLEAGTAALRDDSDADRSEHDSWPWEVLKHVFYPPPSP